MDRGVAIIPTAVSGGGDIRCAMEIALQLKRRGLEVSVMINQGSFKGLNQATIDKIKDSPQFSGIAVYKLEDLPPGFVMPNLIFAGPGSNTITQDVIAGELAGHMVNQKRLMMSKQDAEAFFSRNNVVYIQLEEPGFIGSNLKFNLDPNHCLGMGIMDFEAGLPVVPGQSSPIVSSFSQTPELISSLQDEWLKSQILGDDTVMSYGDKRLLSLIYHHIDFVFERSLYFLASAAMMDSRDIDIVAKVWDPSKPIQDQVARTLIETHEPREEGILGMLSPEILAQLGVSKVVMIRPDKTEEVAVSSQGKMIRIIDPFPLRSDDMDLLRDAAIPIQGCSGLMSVSKGVELNKIPLLEVLPDNRSFYESLLALAQQIDPHNTGLAGYLKTSQSMLHSVAYESPRVYDAEAGQYVRLLNPSEFNLTEKVMSSRGRSIAKYMVIKGNRQEVQRDIATIIKVGEWLRSPGCHREVTMFNQFIVEKRSLYDALIQTVVSKCPSPPDGPGGCPIN
jgi:hypothetical protein